MIIRGATLISRLAVSFTVLFTITACGSGGGGSSFYNGDENAPPDQSVTVSLGALTSTTQGLLYQSLVTASNSEGLNYTGSVVVVNNAQTMFDGVLVTPRDTVISLRNVVDSVTVTGTSYIDGSGYLVGTTTPSAKCIASSPATLPATVSIGNSGPLSTLTCDDNTIQDGNWKAEAPPAGSTGEGIISLVISTTTRDLSNIIVSTENTTYTLDSTGNIISFTSVTTQSASGVVLTVQSV
jgi:predicted small lipoprotein YifL